MQMRSHFLNLLKEEERSELFACIKIMSLIIVTFYAKLNVHVNYQKAVL